MMEADRMKYFIVTVDSNYVPPVPVGWYGKIDRKTLRGKKPYQMQKHLLFYIEKHMQTVFTDVLPFPCFMVSKTVRNVIESYDPIVRFARVVLYDQERKKSMSYYIPFLDRIEPEEKNMALGKNGGAVVLAREKLKEHVIMETEKDGKIRVIMRMDLLESIFRRGAVGIGIEEVHIV